MKEQCANIRSNLIVSNWSSHHQDCLCVFSHFIINHDHFPRHRVLIKNRLYFAVMFAGFSTFYSYVLYYLLLLYSCFLWLRVYFIYFVSVISKSAHVYYQPHFKALLVIINCWSYNYLSVLTWLLLFYRYWWWRRGPANTSCIDIIGHTACGRIIAGCTHWNNGGHNRTWTIYLYIVLCKYRLHVHVGLL